MEIRSLNSEDYCQVQQSELYYGEKGGLLNNVGKGNCTIYIHGDAAERSGMLGSQGSRTSRVGVLEMQLNTNAAATEDADNGDVIKLSRTKDQELPLLSFSCISTVTDYFSFVNKLGEDGLGLFISGFMSPEYAVYVPLSTKYDVFSFGVILLETMSGRKNLTSYGSDFYLNLLGYAWDLRKTQRCEELLDPTLANPCSTNELLLCTQVGLLCVQENPENRPNMSDVFSMLSTQGTTLPIPKEPAFRHLSVIDSDLLRCHNPSLNFVIFTAMEAR
ncbi:Serine-threonine/tyrosine-protein kinase [Theobroma cacao]|nr:Serine-threonine/tyrosine-protein kinase [Theobroma cacao]